MSTPSVSWYGSIKRKASVPTISHLLLDLNLIEPVHNLNVHLFLLDPLVHLSNICFKTFWSIDICCYHDFLILWCTFAIDVCLPIAYGHVILACFHKMAESARPIQMSSSSWAIFIFTTLAILSFYLNHNHHHLHGYHHHLPLCSTICTWKPNSARRPSPSYWPSPVSFDHYHHRHHQHMSYESSSASQS